MKLNSIVHLASLATISRNILLIVINYFNYVLLGNINLTCDNCYDFKI